MNACCRFLAGLAIVLLAPPQAMAQESSVGGRVDFAHVVELRAGVSGVLALGMKAPGSHFQAGDNLFSLSLALYEQRARHAQRQLALTARERDEALASLERHEVLYDEGSLSQLELDTAMLVRERALAAHSEAETAQSTAQAQLSLARVDAAFDGVVLDLAAAPGAYLNAAVESPLVATVAERGALVVRAELAAGQRQGLSLGDAVDVSVGGERWPGSIVALRYLAGDATSWQIDVAPGGSGPELVAGLRAQVHLP